MTENKKIMATFDHKGGSDKPSTRLQPATEFHIIEIRPS